MPKPSRGSIDEHILPGSNWKFIFDYTLFYNLLNKKQNIKAYAKGCSNFSFYLVSDRLRTTTNL